MLFAIPDSLRRVSVYVLATEPAVTTTRRLFPSVPAFLDVTVTRAVLPESTKDTDAATASDLRRR